MGTRFATTGPVGPQLGPDDAGNLRTQFTALLADRDALLNATGLLTTPTLGIGSTKTQVASVAFNHQIDGVRSTRNAVAAGTAFTATTHDIADGYHRIFVLSCVTGATGTITITPGTATLQAAVVEAPATPSGQVKMGEVKIAATGAIFDATTNDLDAAHLTVTYTNAALLGQTAQALTRS